MRSSGAGGQHRNKTDSGVRLTHLPTHTVVTATEDRSQHVNRTIAWERLQSALNEAQSVDKHNLASSTKAAKFNNHRAWTWCSWRDEVSCDDGRKMSMKQAMKGKMKKLIY